MEGRLAQPTKPEEAGLIPRGTWYGMSLAVFRGGDNHTYSAKRQDHYQHGVRGEYNQEVPSRVIGSDSQDRWDLESPRSQCFCQEDLVVLSTLSAYRCRWFGLEVASTHRIKGCCLHIQSPRFYAEPRSICDMRRKVSAEVFGPCKYNFYGRCGRASSM